MNRVAYQSKKYALYAEAKKCVGEGKAQISVISVKLKPRENNFRDLKDEKSGERDREKGRLC